MALLDVPGTGRYQLACDRCAGRFPGYTAASACAPVLRSIAADHGWHPDPTGALHCADCHTLRAGPAPFPSLAAVDLRAVAGAVVVHLAGPLDTVRAPALRHMLHHLDAYQLVVLDLAEVHLIDAAALAVLLRTHQRLRRGGGRLALAALTAGAGTTLHALRLQTVFATYDRVGTALAGHGAGPAAAN